MRRLAPAAALALFLSGCSGDAERLVLLDFFAAARLHDRTALAALATTDFSPATQGIVLRLDVRSVSAVRRQPLSAEPADQSLAGISLAWVRKVGSGPPLTPGQRWAGERWAKDVMFDAVLRRPDGETVERAIVATLERAVVTTPEEAAGRWIVTALADRGPSSSQAG
jgi:hypothetical protein